MIDDDSAEEMVRDNISWMIAVSQKLLGDRALAEDAVQEAFLAAFRGLVKFEDRSSLKTWLHRITVNASLMKFRQLKRQPEPLVNDYQPEFDRYNCRIEGRWTYLASAEDILANEELRAQVHSAIDELPEPYRIVLLLRDIEGYDTMETANLLEISETNVKVRLHRARMALKELLEPVLRGGLLT